MISLSIHMMTVQDRIWPVSKSKLSGMFGAGCVIGWMFLPSQKQQTSQSTLHFLKILEEAAKMFTQSVRANRHRGITMAWLLRLVTGAPAGRAPNREKAREGPYLRKWRGPQMVVLRHWIDRTIKSTGGTISAPNFYTHHVYRMCFYGTQWTKTDIAAHEGSISNRSVSLYFRSSSVLMASCCRSTSICRSCSSRLRSMPGRFSICSRICWNFFCSSFTLRLTSVGPLSRLKHTHTNDNFIQSKVKQSYLPRNGDTCLENLEMSGNWPKNRQGKHYR